MVKYYYYVNFLDNEVSFEGDKIIVQLNGKSFSKIKVLNACFNYNVDIFSPSLKLDTFSGNGFSSDRMGVALCLFDNLVRISANDWRYSTTQTPEYHISPTLNQLTVYVADGAGTIISPVGISNLQFILELDDE